MVLPSGDHAGKRSIVPGAIVSTRTSPLSAGTPEWKQMYREAWRFDAISSMTPPTTSRAESCGEPVRAFVAGIGSCADLNYLFAETVGNMVVSHLGLGGEQLDIKRVQTSLLGCDFTIENGRYRFARVFNGENGNPMRALRSRSPASTTRLGNTCSQCAGAILPARTTCMASSRAWLENRSPSPWAAVPRAPIRAR